MTEFEEGEFRGPLFNQLEKGSNLLWEPGQVFEKIVGIDRASLCINDYLWNLHGFSSPLGGLSLHRRKFRYIWNTSKPKKILPDFNLNLFIQAKCSDYSSRSKKGLKPHIKGAHWYFEITPHQQTALELLEKELGTDALVIYAAPVFHKQQDLYNHTSGQTIVANSTFPKVSLLRGHKKWYFDRGGIKGVANPEYESFDQEDLLSQIEDMRIQKGQFVSEGALSNLSKLSRAVRNVAEIQSGSFLATQFAYENELLDDFIYQYDVENYRETKDYLQVELFSFLWKLNWLTF